MSQVLLQRVTASNFVPVSSHCIGCVGCGASQKSLHIPDIEEDRVTLALSHAAQIQLLWNSWLKPLILIVFVALICSLLHIEEVVAIGLSILAFVVGFAWCRVIPNSFLKVIKVSCE